MKLSNKNNKMKNLKNFAFSILFVAIGFSAMAGNKIVKIQTSSICGMCKNRIELVVNNLDGVKKSMLNIETGILIVKYDTKKITPMQIRIAIAETGYDADDLPKVEEAYEVLPTCCKKAGFCDSEK